MFDHLSDAWQATITSFLDSIEAHSGSKQSRRSYESELRMFFASKSPADVTRADVLSYLNRKCTGRRNTGLPLSPGARNRSLCSINSFFAYAVSFEYNGVPVWPATKASPSFGLKYVKAHSAPRVLEVDVLERILSNLPGGPEKQARDRALLLFYWMTGKRLSEVQRLRWGDLQFTTVVDGDGSRRQSVVFAYRSKGRSREIQHAECPRACWLALEKYLRISGRLESMQPDSPLWTSSRQKKGAAPLCKDYIAMIWRNACEASGIDHAALGGIHVLRHSIARTRWLDGQSLDSLQTFLGHSSLATTAIYVRGITSTSDAFAQRLEQKYPFLRL